MASTTQADTLSSLLRRITAEQDKSLMTVLAREVNNHLYCRSSLNQAAGALNSGDMEIILQRFDLALRTMQLSGNGPEAFQPKGNGGPEAVRRALQVPEHEEQQRPAGH